MKSLIRLINKKQTASFRVVSLMLANAPLWLMLATANISRARSDVQPLTRGLDTIPSGQHAALEPI
jgi:hypothetical protein